MSEPSQWAKDVAMQCRVIDGDVRAGIISSLAGVKRQEAEVQDAIDQACAQKDAKNIRLMDKLAYEVQSNAALTTKVSSLIETNILVEKRIAELEAQAKGQEAIIADFSAKLLYEHDQRMDDMAALIEEQKAEIERLKNP